MALSSGDDLVLRARSGGRTRKVEVKAGGCASVAGEFMTCPVQALKNVLCFEMVSTATENDGVAEAEVTVSASEVETEEARVKDGPEKAEGGDLGELYFELARDV